MSTSARPLLVPEIRRSLATTHPGLFSAVLVHRVSPHVRSSECFLFANLFWPRTGYTGNGFQCTDVDECTVENGGCSVRPMVPCINTVGSSTCGSCPPGYSGDGRTCTFIGKCQVDNGGCHAKALCTGKNCLLDLLSFPSIGSNEFFQCQRSDRTFSAGACRAIRATE